MAEVTREQALAHGRALLAQDPALALEQAQAMLEGGRVDPDADRLAAAALRAIGDHARAEAAEMRALANWQATEILRRAAAALGQGDLAGAETLLRQRLADAPDDGSAKMMLAATAAQVGAYEDAERLLRDVLVHAPRFGPAREELPWMLAEQQRHAEAIAGYDALLAESPRERRWLQRKISLLPRLGKYREALALTETILAEDPDDHAALLVKGNLLKTLGDGAGSEAAYRAITRAAPGNGEAWWGIANLKKAELTADDLATMEAQRAQPAADPEERANLLFSIATAKERARDYPAAFADYAEANALWRSRFPYNPANITRLVDGMIATIDTAWWEARAQGGAPSDAPIFILGMPRAGSTLLEQILSSHSQIEGTAELPYIPGLSRLVGYRAGNPTSPAAIMAAMPGDTLRELGESYLARAGEHRVETTPLFIDKTPNNWMFVPLIRAILPNARIIDARREAMACCFANFKQHFARGQVFTYGLEDLGRYYRDYVRLMAHIDTVAPGHVHRVRYEQVVADTEGEVRRVLDYLGLAFEPQCLRFHENARPVRTASAEQVRRPIERGTNDAWKPFAPWLGPLRSALGELAGPADD